MEKWFIKNKKGNIEEISKSFNISPIVSKVLINRDLNNNKDIEMYFSSDLEKLHNPYQMKDIKKASEIIIDSIDKNEKITIVGDYDQDGNSSIMTLLKGLEKCNANVNYIIPHRVEDGYGINKRIVERCKEDNTNLIITCDNGISAFDAVEHAKKLGLKIIVTDHHDIPYEELDNKKIEKLVNADAVVNPKREDCEYPFDKLCGAGVAFKLIQVLFDMLNIPKNEAYGLLEFVAMGTVCDVVDLVDENRIIVKEGLKKLNNTDNIGLKSLIETTGLKDKEITAYHLGFIIGPCVNASGRLESADMAVELFLSEDEENAKILAENLKELNDERKEMTRKGYEKIVDDVEKKGLYKEKIIIGYEPSIHESIVGIIAGRIKDKYNKPTIIFTNGQEEGVIKGSARSIEEYNMYEKINEVNEYLVSFGGHPMAAGLSLKKDNLEIIYKYLISHTDLTDDDLIPKKYIDMHLPLDKISRELIEELSLLEPYGKANSRPVFAEKNIRVNKLSILGQNKNVLKFEMINNDNRLIEGIYFGDIEGICNYYINKFGINSWENALRGLDNNLLLDIIYYPNINIFMEKISLQAVIQGYR